MDFIMYDGNDPLTFVLSLNLHRRHLNESQRAMVAACLANMNVGRNSANLPNKTSQDDSAAMLHVSTRSVRSAKKFNPKACRRRNLYSKYSGNS